MKYHPFLVLLRWNEKENRYLKQKSNTANLKEVLACLETIKIEANKCKTQWDQWAWSRTTSQSIQELPEDSRQKLESGKSGRSVLRDKLKIFEELRILRELLLIGCALHSVTSLCTCVCLHVLQTLLRERPHFSNYVFYLNWQEQRVCLVQLQFLCCWLLTGGTVISVSLIAVVPTVLAPPTGNKEKYGWLARLANISV